VGRDREMAQLLDALSASLTGTTVCLISGEAGIGKTRLATELGEVARSQGHRVVWGHGWEESGAPPHWPWTQVVRQLLGVPSGVDLASLVLPDADPTDRFELFDAVAAAIHHESERAPLVVILDDLHLADPPTMALVRFVTAHLRSTPLLIAGTFRDQDLARRDDLTDHLEALGGVATTIHLSGLDVAAVGELLGSKKRARDLHTATAGNPLFIEQVVQSGGNHMESLRSVLDARVEALGLQVVDILAAAGVLGRSPAVDDLASLVELPRDDVLARLRTAAEAGLFDLEALAFAHPLIAESALAQVGQSRRERLHSRAADLVVIVDGNEADRANHLCNAGSTRWRDAVAACQTAAEDAAEALAHEDAVAQLRRAEQLVERNGTEDDVAIAFEVTFALARAMVQAFGRASAEDYYLAAWDLAHQAGDPRLIARSAARHGVQYYFAGDVSHAIAANAREALEALDEDDTELHARLHATLATALVVDSPGEAVSHADRAVSIARAAKDPFALAVALTAQHVADLGPATLPRRLGSAREIIALAESVGAHDLAVHGNFLLMGALLERGEVSELDAYLTAQHELISHYASPRFARHATWFRCTRAMFDGNADAVEALANECFAIAERLGDPDGIGVWGAQYGIALWMRGRVFEMEQAYVERSREQPTEPVWQGVLAWLWSSHGKLDLTRGALDRLPATSELPSGQHTLLTLVTIADAAVALSDDALVAELWEALLPYADRVVPIAMGAACWGTVSHHLGRLALHLGRTDEGIAHLERSIAICARMGARPWLVDSQLTLAEALVADCRLDNPRAERLVAEASATVAELDLVLFSDRVEALTTRIPVIATPHLSDLTAVVTSPDVDTTTAHHARVAVLGTFEVTAADGSTPHWTSRKARELLKILVARRGRLVSREVLMDLLWPDEDPATLTNRLSVALSTVRRALDPARALPSNALVEAAGGALRLNLAAVDVDVETFLMTARDAIAAHRSDPGDALGRLRSARDLYSGDALPDEPYARWAQSIRSEARDTWSLLLRCDAEAAIAAGDLLGAADAHRRLLECDPYDESAHLGLISSLRELGAHGQATAAHQRYVAAMAELGVTVDSPST
jgi:DNA-binding SARP family transcriptional activator